MLLMTDVYVNLTNYYSFKKYVNRFLKESINFTFPS